MAESMSSLHLLLPPEPATEQSEYVHVLSPDGRQVVRHGLAAASLLPRPSGPGSETVAVVPADQLSWHLLALPPGTSARSPRLRAVLEGLLEERLLDEPEQLHFALGPRTDADGRHWVAVCDRGWLRAHLQSLDRQGLPVSRVVPELAPEGEPLLVASGDPQRPRLALASADGVVVLPLQADVLAQLPGLPAQATLVAEPAVAALAEQCLQRTPVLQQLHARLLASAATSWDLAQAEFASHGRARVFKRLSALWAAWWRGPQWRPARWAAGVLVLAQLAGLNAWAWKERNALTAKREAARSLLTSTFPNVRAVVDAPVQMEREVAALRQRTGASSGGDLESLLGALAQVTPPGRSASAVEYTGTELRVRGLAAAPADATPILEALRPLGYAGALQGDTLVVRPETQP